VSATCLRGLTSYRFAGSFSLRTSTPTATAAPTAGDGGVVAGSIANLLSDVSFQGEALAPDRYAARIGFGGTGVQTLEVSRIGPLSYSRFGNGPWQSGDQVQGLGGISQFDPQSVCERSLIPLDAGGESPSHETVNGMPCLRYTLTGTQVARSVLGGRASTGTPVATSPVSQPISTVWVAERGGYPVRLQMSGATVTGTITLELDISDVNGRDIQISPP